MFLLRRLCRKNKVKLEKEQKRQKIIDNIARLEEQKRLDRIYIKRAVEQLLAKNRELPKSTHTQ